MSRWILRYPVQLYSDGCCNGCPALTSSKEGYRCEVESELIYPEDPHCTARPDWCSLEADE